MSVVRGGELTSDSIFFNDTATTEIYTLSLHDALPILILRPPGADEFGRGCRSERPDSSPQEAHDDRAGRGASTPAGADTVPDRKSTRLNSSHANISYAVFCLKKKILIFFPLLPAIQST